MLGGGWGDVSVRPWVAGNTAERDHTRHNQTKTAAVGPRHEGRRPERVWRRALGGDEGREGGNGGSLTYQSAERRRQVGCFSHRRASVTDHCESPLRWQVGSLYL